MKFITKSYGNNINILAFPDHYVAVPVVVDSTGIVANSDGKKIVKAGTIMGGGFTTIKTEKAIEDNTATAEGVLLYDVDVTYGDHAGAVVIHGFVSKHKLPTAPDATAIAALKQITFLI